jgi:YVTN family beta-propeller protein
MKPYVVRRLAAVLWLLGACSAQESFPVQSGRPVLDPTATTEVTPVPLALTPISTVEPLPGLPPLLNSRSSKTLALAGDTLVTVNSESGTITLVDTNTDTVKAEIPVGDDPRTVAITPDDAHALVTLRGANALAVVDLETQSLERVMPVGHMPYGVVTDGRRAFVSCFADDQLAVLDLESGEALYRVTVPDAPAGLAVSGDWLLITHFYSGFVTVLNVERTPVLVGSVNVEPDGNLARTILLSPDGQQAYIPQTRTGLALVSLQYMQDWFPVVGVLNLARMTGDRDARLTVSMLDTAANMPFDAAFADGGDTLYVVLAGSDAVIAVALESRALRARIPVGANPRGIVVANSRAFVLNALDGTVSVIHTVSYEVLNTIRVTNLPLDPILLRGEVLFHQASAPTMSDGAISCATCHFDGGADARTWINFRSGPRNTPSLGDVAAMPPYNWAGDMDELHDTIEDQIRSVMLGDGLIRSGTFDPTIPRVDAGRSADLDALAAYVTSLEAWPSPYREADGALSESAQRGMRLFLSGSPNCGCHTPPLYTDGQQHNLSGAAFSMETYAAFDTPTLRGLWATAPYMHDGVAQTLEEALTRTDPTHSAAGRLSEEEFADLIAFLLSL